MSAEKQEEKPLEKAEPQPRKVLAIELDADDHLENTPGFLRRQPFQGTPEAEEKP